MPVSIPTKAFPKTVKGLKRSSVLLPNSLNVSDIVFPNSLNFSIIGFKNFPI